MLKNILLMKDALDDDSYVGCLSKIGNVSCISALSFEFCNLDQVKDALKSINLWSGVIFTSKRSVESIMRAFPVPLPEWSSVPCFAVGEATAKSAIEIGFNAGLDSGIGTGKQLAEFIISKKDSLNLSKPLLFICGQKRRDELPKILKSENLLLKEVVSYKTISNVDCTEKISSYVASNGVPNYIVFFSPSGVTFSLNSWKIIWKKTSSFSKIVSIGPTTTKALTVEGFSEILTAQRPKPENIFQIIHDDLFS